MPADDNTGHHRRVDDFFNELRVKELEEIAGLAGLTIDPAHTALESLHATTDMGNAKTPPKSKPKPKSKYKIKAQTKKQAEDAERARKKAIWDDDEQAFTNKDSPMATINLTAAFAQEESWKDVTPEEWAEIATTMPEHMLHPDGTIDMDQFWQFVKYSPIWKGTVRNFQEDLAAGRREPEWLAQAAQAMEERAEGKFDDWKEKNFEEFWGQKQKVDTKALSGMAASLKLDVLVKGNCFKVGDVWSYGRTFKREGDPKIFVEKNVMIVAIAENKLTFIIPTGRQVFLKLRDTEDSNKDDKTTGGTKNGKKATHEISKENSPTKDGKNDEDVPTGNSDQPTSGSKATEGFKKHKDPNSTPIKAADLSAAASASVKRAKSASESLSPLSSAPPSPSVSPAPQAISSKGGSDPKKRKVLSSTPTTTNDTTTAATSLVKRAKKGSQIPSSSSTYPLELPLVTELTQKYTSTITFTPFGPTALENRILEIDGRITPEKRSHANAWKSFRCWRDNQDIGGLWDVREFYYEYKHPH